MKNNHIPIDCNNCRQCCHFHLFVGESLSTAELQTAFFFNNKHIDTFFNRENELYKIDKTCKQYKNDKCIIHNTDKYPSICALYPLMIVNLRQNCFLVIDKACPQWRNFYTKFKKDQHFRKSVFKIIDYFINANELDLVQYKHLKKCGYKFKNIFRIV